MLSILFGNFLKTWKRIVRFHGIEAFSEHMIFLGWLAFFIAMTYYVFIYM